MDCIEAGCYDFESSDLSLTIDINPAAGRPTFEKQYASYCENYARIDGADAWIWYFEDKDKFKHAGVNFTFERGGDYRIGIYLLSEKKDIKKISERIFKSVKFKKRPKKK